MVMPRFFSSETLARGDAYANSVKSVLLGTDPIGYSGCCAALRDFDFTGSMTKIRVPTLVIAGDRDVSTPWEGHGQLLANNIPDARARAPHGVSFVESGASEIVYRGII